MWVTVRVWTDDDERLSVRYGPWMTPIIRLLIRALLQIHIFTQYLLIACFLFLFFSLFLCIFFLLSWLHHFPTEICRRFSCVATSAIDVKHYHNVHNALNSRCNIFLEIWSTGTKLEHWENSTDSTRQKWRRRRPNAAVATSEAMLS